MKKILLSLFGIITLGFINFSSSEQISITLNNVGGSSGTGQLTFDNNSVYCMYASYNSSTRYVVINFQGYNGNVTTYNSGGPICFSVGSSDNILNYEFGGGSYSQLFYYKVMPSSSCDYSDYVLESDITQSYCTNKFSDLILESDVTQNYCELEFGLIDPSNCPSSGGTGDVLRSSFWVNDRQIEGASNIYLYLPDFLSWGYTYLDNGSTLQVDVENQGDEQYINNLLEIETYHPSSDEFAVSFVGYLTLLMPYIIISLFIVFVWKLIKRVFK